jgi:hypothetical protein
MSDFIDERGEINWRIVFELLGSGRVVEIPCYSESDYLRRSKQAAKRTEKQGIAIDILRGENVVLLQPREQAAGGVANDGEGENGESRAERRQRRVQRREATRADGET